MAFMFRVTPAHRIALHAGWDRLFVLLHAECFGQVRADWHCRSAAHNQALARNALESSHANAPLVLFHEGPAVILINGALVYRDHWGHRPLAALLADQFTVYTYDRRGRGESGDSSQASAGVEFRPTLALEREIEDIEALIDEAGGEPIETAAI
jgi:pimeloyl-ACP methyl ester carboxylesterase